MKQALQRNMKPVAAPKASQPVEAPKPAVAQPAPVAQPWWAPDAKAWKPAPVAPVGKKPKINGDAVLAELARITKKST